MDKTDEDNVVDLFSDDEEITVDEVLEMSKGMFDSVIIIGYNTEGQVAVSTSPGLTSKDSLWLVEALKAVIMKGDIY